MEALVISRKRQKHCEGCRLDEGARFRLLANLWLCEDCYRRWLESGEVPPPVLADTREEGRW